MTDKRPSSQSRPHLLLILVDQLRPDHAGFMPEAVFSTPTLAALGAESHVLQNCQTVNPVCMPARSALITGRYSHQVGAQAMAGDLPRGIPTFPQALQRAGYWTAHVGKLHLLQPWPWGVPEGQGSPLAALRPELQAYGFDWLWESAGKQLAVKNTCDWCGHLAAKGLLQEVRAFISARGANRDFVDAELEKDGRPWPFAEADHVDVVTGDQALRALRARPRDKPFQLTVSFCSPHKPFDPPQRWLDEVPLEEVDDFLPDAETGRVLTEAEKQTLYRLRQAYRATILLVDRQIQRILDELSAQGIRDETLIIFTSDHGEMMGDHGRVQKSSFYRSSLTVPTLIQLPGQTSGQVWPSPVELTDLSATLLDAAGLDPAPALSRPWPAYQAFIPCRSLLPYLRGGKAPRAWSFSESQHHWQCLQDAEYKYVREPDFEQPGVFREWLFGLQQDPGEQVNLAADPGLAAHCEQCRRQLDWLLATTPAAQTAWSPFGQA